MAGLIPSISFSEFKKFKAYCLRKRKSFEVTADGEHLMTVVIPQTAFIREQVEYLAQLSNSVGGEDLPEEKSDEEKT